MSSSTWTQCAARSSVCALRAEPWRAVESQHYVPTMRLVDTLEEQAILEDLLESTKPSLPEAARPLHYLLATPFRYPPLRHGSRFGRRHERGVWYGSLAIATALAETAYYRLVFLEGTAAELPRLHSELTVFRARVHTARGLDTRRLDDDTAAALSSPVDYAASQAFGADAREAGVELLLFPSARDPDGGANAAVFSPAAFSHPAPLEMTTWTSAVSRDRVDFVRKNVIEPRPDDRRSYARALFEIDGRLPAPAI